MSLIRKAVERMQDIAGGVGGTRKETGRPNEGAEPDKAQFESQESRRAKNPGDNLPMPEGVERDEARQ
jgi:hypothetical protein